MFKLLLTALFALGSFVVQADVVLIVNESVAIDSIKKKDAKKVFLGKSKKFSDGSKVVIVIQKKGDTHKEFVKAVVGKSSSQYKTYWKKLVFTGKGKQPKTVKSDADVLAYVARTKGAMGYIAGGSSTDGAKVVALK